MVCCVLGAIFVTSPLFAPRASDTVFPSSQIGGLAVIDATKGSCFDLLRAILGGYDVCRGVAVATLSFVLRPRPSRLSLGAILASPFNIGTLEAVLSQPPSRTFHLAIVELGAGLPSAGVLCPVRFCAFEVQTSSGDREGVHRTAFYARNGPGPWTLGTSLEPFCFDNKVVWWRGTASVFMGATRLCMFLGSVC